jgi:hypothetical protein
VRAPVRTVLWLTGVLGVAALTVRHAPRAWAPPSDTRLAARVEPLHGEAIEGRLVSLSLESVVLETAGGRRSLATGELVSLRLAPAAAPDTSTPKVSVRLVDGGVLTGTIAGPAQDGVGVDTEAAGVVDVPLEAIRSIESVPAGDDGCSDAAARHPPTEGLDTVHVASGDAYTGIVAEVVHEGLRIEPEHGAARTVAWGDLVVAHLQNPDAPPPTGVHAEVVTVDGDVFVATKASASEDGTFVAVRSPALGREVRIPAAAVHEVAFSGGRFARVSSLAFTEEWSAYYGDDSMITEFERRWYGARRDRRPFSGCPLRVGGTTYRHGIGVHPRSRITIPLKKSWSAFRARFGIDDEVLAHPPPHGDVDARVLVDGRVAWEAKGVKGGEALRDTGMLDVSDAETLVLEVDFGGALFALDHADWIEPILVRR